MERKLYTKDEVNNFILQGKVMVLSADENVINQLPAGNWIAGTTPYFMDKEKGVFSKDLIFVDDFSEIAIDFKIETYNHESIKNLAENSFLNGFTVLILPLDTQVYSEFALKSLTYENIYRNPLVGYVAGFDFKDFGKAKSKIVNGLKSEVHENLAIAMHIALPNNKIARTEIINLDSILENSAQIVFPKTSFSQSDCLINGEKANIAEYLIQIAYKNEAPRPLIANTNGALINRDIKTIDIENKQVSFFSPVYADDIYYLTKAESDYQFRFNKYLNEYNQQPVYTTICVSYYLLGELEHKKIGIEGIFAFGEIAYQLLNKTLVLLEIDEI